MEYRPASLWRDHRNEVLGGVIIGILQTAIIVALLVEHRRRQAEVDARQNLVAMAHLDRRAAMGELATSLAHEINQPLNAILMMNGMDAVADAPAERRRVFVRILEEGGRIGLTVRDLGTGIPQDRIGQIFDAFFTTKREGMGMGLAIARSIVDAHEGRIAAENNVGGGATVWFSVPKADVVKST